jgi:hypothetical protein
MNRELEAVLSVLSIDSMGYSRYSKQMKETVKEVSSHDSDLTRGQSNGKSCQRAVVFKERYLPRYRLAGDIEDPGTAALRRRRAYS